MRGSPSFCGSQLKPHPPQRTFADHLLSGLVTLLAFTVCFLRSTQHIRSLPVITHEFICLLIVPLSYEAANFMRIPAMLKERCPCLHGGALSAAIHSGAGTSVGESIFLTWHQDQARVSPTQAHSVACTSLLSVSQMRCLQHLARSRACPPAGGLGRLADPTHVSPHFSGVDCPSHPCRAWSWLDAPEALHQSLPAPPLSGPALPLRQDPAPACMLPGQPGSIRLSCPWATEFSAWSFLGSNIPRLLASQLGPPSSSRAETKAL